MSSDRTSKEAKTKEKSASSKKSQEHQHGEDGSGEERTPKSTQKKTNRSEKHSSTGKQESGEEKRVDAPSAEPVEKLPTASSTVKVEEEAPTVPTATAKTTAASTSDEMAAVASDEPQTESNRTSKIQVQQESAAQTGPTAGELVKRDELTEALQHFDHNDNGTIAAGELRRLLTTMGDKMTDVEIGEFLQGIGQMGSRAALLGSSDRYSRYRHKRISMAPDTRSSNHPYADDDDEDAEEALYRGSVKIADVMHALYPM